MNTSQQENRSFPLKKIVMITWNFPPKKGGMENLLYDIYSHLSSDYEITVVAPAASSAGTESNIYRPGKDGFLYFVFFAVLQGFRLFRKGRVNIVFGGSLAVLPVLMILKIFRLPCVAYAHGLDIIYDNFLYQTMLRVCVPRMDGVICNSLNTRQLLLQKFAKIKNITVIPPGVNREVYRDDPDRPYQRKYLLSVGRLVPRKGLVSFIEHSFRHIAEKFKDVDFIIVGEEPQEAMYHRRGYRQEILNCIDKHGLQERVLLLGWVEENRKFSFYQHCECLVFPVIPVGGDVEGFGIVAIEAGLMGRPTVAFNVGGIRDAIVPDSGVLADPEDYRTMTVEIQNILDGKRFHDSAAVSAAVKDHYSWRRLVSEYIDFLESISQ